MISRMTQWSLAILSPLMDAAAGCRRQGGQPRRWIFA